MPRKDRIGSKVTYRKGDSNYTGKVVQRKDNGKVLIMCLDGPNRGNTKTIDRDDIISSTGVKQEKKKDYKKKKDETFLRNIIESKQPVEEIVNDLAEAHPGDPLDKHYLADALEVEAEDADYGPDRTDDLETIAHLVRQKLMGDVGFQEVVNLIDREERFFSDPEDTKELVRVVWETI